MWDGLVSCWRGGGEAKGGGVGQCGLLLLVVGLEGWWLWVAWGQGCLELVPMLELECLGAREAAAWAACKALECGRRVVASAWDGVE